MSHTFLLHQAKDIGQKASEAVGESVEFLISNDFISSIGDKIEPNRLANATLAATFAPEDALFVYTALQRGLKSLILQDELHLVYLITPIIVHTPNWASFLDICQNMSAVHLEVAETIGIKYAFLVSLSQGFEAPKDSRLAIHTRFFYSLLLFDLIKEVSVSILTRKYSTNRGTIQQLQSLCSTYSGMVRIFCARLGWKFYDVLIAQIQNRLVFGVEADLLELAQIPGVDRLRAKILFKLGLKTPYDVSRCEPNVLSTAFETLLSNSPDLNRYKLAVNLIQQAQDYCFQKA